ncbi:CHAT domain-containing protein [Dactylosporangium darangshiense]|uniref:CHAT domain-containing protein n=1 Tax=Dactylosporangium darangshiense TaxID=579108 RepID=A0ABP8DUG0_9ACTN
MIGPSFVEDRLVQALRDLLAGHPIEAPPIMADEPYRDATRQLVQLLTRPRDEDGDGWVQAAGEAVEECERLEWVVGVCVGMVLRGLPSLERAEDRVRNRPEALRREATGWRMLSRVTLSGSGSSLFSMAPLFAFAEAERLDEEAGVVDGIDLCAEAPAIEDLVDAASMLRVEEATARAAGPLLEALAEDVTRALRADRWDEVAAGRARYWQRWHQFAHTVPIPRTEALATRPYLATCRLLGQNVGLMHHRAGITSGALMLENFTEHGVMRTFESSAGLGASLEQVVADLLPLRFQLWGPRLQQFHEGYLEGYEDDGEAGYVALATMDRIAQATRGDPDPEGKFPARHLQLPHFVIRATGHVLRTDGSRRPQFAERLEALADVEPRDRIEQATAVLVEAADVDENAAGWAAGTVCNAAVELVDAGDADLALSMLEWCLHAAEDLAPDLVRMMRGLVWMLRGQQDPDTATQALRRAATWFQRDGQWAWARNSLREALRAAAEPQTRGEVLVELLRAYIDETLDTNDGGPAAEAAGFEIDDEGLPEPLRRRIEAHVLAARSMITAERDERHGLARRALDLVADAPDGDGFRALVTDMVPPWEQRGPGERDRLAALVPVATMDALYGQDEEAALDRLRADLDAMTAAGAPAQDWVTVAGRLALVATNAADMLPHRKGEIAAMVHELTERYRALLPPAGDSDPALEHALNNVGWAAASLHGHLPDHAAEDMLDAGIDLLERAVAARPADQAPTGFSAAANNLAMGYRDRARRLDGDARIEQLRQARELMTRVLAVDERLAGDGAPRGTLGIDLDHLNLGLICVDLAEATYEATWIHRKSMDSARWYRRAAQHFTQSRQEAEAAGAPARAGTAASMVAHVATAVCGWYLRERSAADGDLQRAMYDWTCTVAGATHTSTADFIHLCAGTSIAAAADATAAGNGRNPSLMLECARMLLNLWNLAERRAGLPPAIARDARMTALESLQQMVDAGLDRNYPGLTDGLADLLALLQAALWVDLHDLTGEPRYLSGAHERYRALTGSTDAVVRALARPRARWLDAAVSAGQTVCGLSLRTGPDGLALRISAQARDVRLGGLVADTVEAGVIPTADLRDLARFASGHLRPMMDWDPLPTATARARVAGHQDGTPFELVAAALPVPTWDTWMLQLTTQGPEPLRLTPDLPYLGAFDTTAGRLDPATSAAAADHTRVLLFGRPGLTLHVLLPADLLDGGDERLRVHGPPDRPVLEVAAREVFLLLQATPRISAAQVAFLVKTGDPVAGAVCAGSFLADAPDPGMPATALQTFAPLFPFQARVPTEALDTLGSLPVTVLVMVGLPDDLDHLDDLLSSLVDPRRELLLIVDPDEYPVACAAAEWLRARIQSRMSAWLLESAASFGTYHEALSGVQVICADRASAPAAAQMLLDLAALRRVNPDDIPELVDGRPVFVSTKGNPTGNRRLRTLFREPAGFGELLDRYRDLSDHPPRLVLGDAVSPVRRQLMTLTLPRRPVLLLLPGDPALVAAIPLARHLGAILLFASDDGVQACTQLAPPVVYATAPAAARLPAGAWTVHELPADPADLAAAFHAIAARAHADLLAELPSRHPELLANRGLLAEMAPSGYTMLVTDSPEERPWALLAANYAAALNAPVLLVDGELPRRDPRLAAAAGLLDAARWTARADPGRDLATEDEPSPPAPVPIGLDVLGAAGARLSEMAPAYLGFMSSRADFPIELVGDPPIATRYAVGRLAGPDLDSTALLVLRAALAEDVPRPPRIGAVVADAGLAVRSRPLPGARAEAGAVHARLDQQADVATTFLQGEGDLFDFIAGLPAAGLVHFAGHGRYDEARPERSGLVFDSGILTPLGLPPLDGSPIVFGNACQSGLLNGGGPAAAAWTGLAASFLLSGAANYLGSLWPIYDDSSRALAEEFYELLCAGVPVGEALRRARLAIHAAGDPTWAAFVLFGCPRIRVRPMRTE